MAQDKIQRRKILRGIAAGSSVAGITGMASGAGQDVSADERDHVLSITEVRRTLAVAEYPQVGKIKKGSAVVGKNGNRIISYVLPTEVGKMVFSEYQSYKSCRLALSSESTGDVPDKYSIVQEVDFLSITVRDGGEVTFQRSPTENELSALRQVAEEGIEPESTYFSSNYGGFIIGHGSDYSILEIGDEDGLEPVDEERISSSKVERYTLSEECDRGACEECVKFLGGGIATCGGICGAAAISPPVSLPALIPCLGCVAASGTGLGYFCSECLETCG